MARPYKHQSSAEIETQIQALLEKKNKAVDFTDGEINYIVEPCKNFERNVFKKKQAEEKKKEAA